MRIVAAMTFGPHQDLVLLALLVSIAALLVLAPVLRVPYPILLVLGGLALGFVPGIPTITLPPDVVLVAILPPLLYSAAFYTSLRDLRQNIIPISALAIGLVAATTVGVAAVAHWLIPHLGWGPAFVLGAIVSPTDPLAATAIARRFGLPRRTVSIVEGESLVNDGTALVLYRVAVTAAVASTFSIWDASWRLLWSIGGGVAIGLVVGFVIAAVRRRLDNPPVEVTIALITGYLAFIPTNAVGASGVLAVVTAGIYLGWHTPELTSFQTRLQGAAVWEILVFVLNALLFALVGMQLSHILDALAQWSNWKLAGYGVLVTATVIQTRVVWLPIFIYLPRVLWGSTKHPPKPPAHSFLISWAGMRGAVSLAAALAIPLTTDA